MEIVSSPKKWKCAKAMGASSEEQEDRLSGLPDDGLHSILGGLSLKHAVRTSALSRRWARLWIHAVAASAVLDFTDRDFVRDQSPAQNAATVARCVGIHGAAPIYVLRVALSPIDALGQHVLEWVATAIRRGAREVAVDLAPRGVLHSDDASLLQVPGDLFQAENSLAVLSLGRCGLRNVPPGASGLAGLPSLSLDRVDVTDDALRDVVSECWLLEFLSLRSCHLLASVRVAGERLRGLEIVGCLAMCDLHVAAPALESFAFHGDILYSRDGYETDPVVFGTGNSMTTWSADTPELRDAYLSHLGFGGYDPVIHDFAYSCALLKVAHARILTLCSKGLLHIDVERNCLEFSVHTPNLEELQLLMDSMGDDDVAYFSGFFELADPLILERLFVRLPAACKDTTETSEDDDIVLDEEISLDHLTFIKMVNFRGTIHELRLLRFVLRRAPILEQLVLVTPEEEGTLGDHDQLLKIVQEHVSETRKAWRDAHVTVCRPREDDSRSPAHTKYYHDDQAHST